MSKLKFTPVDSIAKTVAELRENFKKHITIPTSYRIAQLQALQKLCKENHKDLFNAMQADLHMDHLVCTNEILGTINEIDEVLHVLRSWVADEPKNSGLPAAVLPASAFIHKDPLGVILIISPWNYPVSLVTRPLIGAIAAGNCVVIKPSEVSENVSALLGSLLEKYMDPKTLRVVQGAVPETTELLKMKFDKILYTGNGTVGKIVMRAASEFLTPVVLELGGKSPCIIDSTADLNSAIPRITWGKWMNAGQTCIAPDYILCHKDKVKSVIELFKKKITEFYGEDPKKSADYGRIISERHAKRIVSLMSHGTPVTGGVHDVTERYVAPTVLTDVKLDSPLMQDEIFGPLLPIIPINSIDEALSFVNARPKPLALYIFCQNKDTIKNVLSHTSSGGACVNEVILHNICPDLPFGGVGDSGHGAYNGKISFDTFTHQKSVLVKSNLLPDPYLRFPPFTDKKVSLITSLAKLKSRQVRFFFAALLVVILAVLYAYFFSPFQ